MATRPTQSVINACRVLRIMKDNARLPRTVQTIARDSEGTLTVDQVEGILLAFEQEQLVQRMNVEGVGTWYLLGAFHLQLAQSELAGLLSDLAQVNLIMEHQAPLKAFADVLAAATAPSQKGA